MTPLQIELLKVVAEGLRLLLFMNVERAGAYRHAQEISRVLHALDLEEKAHATKDLSGGAD